MNVFKPAMLLSVTNCVCFCLLTAVLHSGCNRGESSPTVAPEWVLIPGGKYLMGYPDERGQKKEHPLHTEVIQRFSMTKTEVTLAQFDACVAAGVCWYAPDAARRKYCNTKLKILADHPINCVDWYQAAAYCAWVGGRLPTEAEWEYAARSGGKDQDAPWGDAPASCELAVVDEKPGFNCGKWKSKGPMGTSPVCSRPAGNSDQGVCDLLGNVIEWTGDWFYHTYDYESFKTVPKTFSAASNESTYHRVMRGGGVGSTEPMAARNRIFHHPWFNYMGLGIRCVK